MLRHPALAFLCLALRVSPVFAGFASTETFLPAVGRVPGQGGAQFYTTVWASNLTTAPQTLTFEFLKQGQANTSPAQFTDSLAPGETKVYENVVESKLGLANAVGAARVTSSGEIFVSERIYNRAAGADAGDAEGLFFAGVPKSFSISAGQSASIQGIDQGGAENFRYNFALIETGGGSPTVDVQVFDGNGEQLGQKAYALLPYEQIQPNVADVVPDIRTTNARITATVTGGAGSVVIAGARLANGSQGSSGFEMSFRGSILGNRAPAKTGVTSLNGLAGALTLTPGSGISITPSGNQISIASTGSGLTAVAHDASLAGDGTAGQPLGIANGQVVRSLNGLHDNLTLAAGSNVTITPSGSTLTIASSEGGGGLTLPFAGTAATSDAAFSVANSGSGDGIAGTTSGSGLSTAGVSGTCPTDAVCAGVLGTGQTGLSAHGAATGLYAESTETRSVALYAVNDASTGFIARFENGFGVDRATIDTSGNLVATAVKGLNNASQGVAVLGRIGAGSGDGIFGGAGVWGDTASFAGIGTLGTTDKFGVGVLGVAGSQSGRNNTVNGEGVWGDSHDGVGVVGTSAALEGVLGVSSDNVGVVGVGGTVGVVGYVGQASGYSGSAGLWGDSAEVTGVYGTSVNDVGVRGVSFDTYGVYANGGIGGTGAKFFVEPHPGDPTKEIRYISLEGRESGTYFRGTGHVVNGFATIEVPDDFRMVSSADGLTVQLTPIGGMAVLAAVTRSLDKIVVQGSSDVEFDYMVNGVRKAFEGFVPVSENRDFIPRSPNDRALTAGLPAEGLRRLKATGILNADGTINLETAHRMGWDRQESWKHVEEEQAKR